ncbi:glycosyltransferase family 4 protein [Phenylobacterium sp.]|uniref:glycosyltransferase family 4 protein n=1 Tax=Phenylobacterium sp. TaxID=1871053 RepID=UPI002810BA9D|nr:glycosyltransferase family 4 protein [Phenylobacterium sp.]
MDAAILFENDGYRLDGPKLMGRQAAGNGFLRAAVAAQAGRTIWGFSPYSNAAEAFRRTVLELDENGQTAWIANEDLRTMSQRGVLFRPDGELGAMADFRLRAGPASYSLCGLTHTLSGKPLTSFAAYPAQALAPWDALICTSRAALRVIEGCLAAGEEFLSWRAGTPVRPPRPQLPVIPLGVHTADFDFSPDDRVRARAVLGLAEEEVGVLFAGRLVFHAKAHPFQMFEALEAAAQASKRKIVLILAGQAPNEAVLKAYNEGLAAFCPSIRATYVDGKDFDRYRACWAAADIFISLSDNIQETFGITPLEAMASGVPVVVSDWDGYRDTVRDGEDGFRITTFAPEPGQTDHIARGYEAGTLNYDYMLYRTCVAVSMDAAMLSDRLTRLVSDPDLRRRMGAAGRERARTIYDWAHIYRRYQELWDELQAIRTREYAADRDRWERAPRSAPGHRDPFRAFAGFSTGELGPQTRVAPTPAMSVDRYFQLEGADLFSHWKIGRPVVAAIFSRLAQGEATIAELQAVSGVDIPLTVEVVARFVKMNLVRPV